jgi:diguanylate cyclase (GGDEF)-like protein
MNRFSSRSMLITQSLVGLLVLLTPALLIWQHFGMTRIVEISPRQPHHVTVTDDRYEHGNSVASLALSKDAIIMRCTLGMAYEWPFCKLQFLLGSAGKGMDLSQFDSITFNMRYMGPPASKLRLHVLNFEPGFSTIGPTVADWHSQRFNQVEFDVPVRPTFTIPVNVLHTADWWMVARKVPLEQSYTRLDNVTAVEISAGIGAVGSVVTIELESIQFRGKWISQTKLLMCLLYAWIGSGILGLTLSVMRYRAILSASNSRMEQLAAINKALELEARELADQAQTDPLTGALNRQGLREMLMGRLQSPGHYGEGLAVIFMDIDHFKRINDRHGHDAGDEVLRGFAAVIRHEVRARDKLVRWGGEEFLLVCPDTNQEQAAKLAEKLRAAMMAHSWPHALSVTSSFGVTALRPEEDIGAAITRADGALYAAKSNGRNRVEVA